MCANVYTKISFTQKDSRIRETLNLLTCMNSRIQENIKKINKQNKFKLEGLNLSEHESNKNLFIHYEIKKFTKHLTIKRQNINLLLTRLKTCEILHTAS